MAIPVPLQEALRDSITSGTFIDTKFWVFSKRSSKAGRVGEPKALFVNGHVVRRVPRLATRMFVSLVAEDSYLTAAVLDKKETKENLRTGFPVDRKPYTGDYDYDDDSDLEEDEDWDSSDIEDSQVIPEKGKTDQPDSATVVNSRDSDTKGNESPDIISVSDVDSLFSDSDDTKTRTEIPTTPTSTHTGTVAVIEDVAFVTYVCFSFSYYRLSDLARQIPGAASLLVYERDRVRAMGICRKTEGTRPGGNRRVVRDSQAVTEIHLSTGRQGCDEFLLPRADADLTISTTSQN